MFLCVFDLLQLSESLICRLWCGCPGRGLVDRGFGLTCLSDLMSVAMSALKTEACF